MNVETEDSSARLQLILRAYQQGRTKLESLTLELYYAEQRDNTSEMALLLVDPSSKPPRYLRICFSEEDTSSTDALVASSFSNRTLEVLKVITVGLDSVQRQQVKAKLNVLNGELLALCTPSSIKLVFLSGVERYRVARDNSRGMGKFDSLGFSRIFQFAGSSARRRVVAGAI